MLIHVHWWLDIVAPLSFQLRRSDPSDSWRPCPLPRPPNSSPVNYYGHSEFCRLAVSPGKQRRWRTSTILASVERSSSIEGGPHAPARLVAQLARATGPPSSSWGPEGRTSCLKSDNRVQEWLKCARLVKYKCGSSDITSSMRYAGTCRAVQLQAAAYCRLRCLAVAWLTPSSNGYP